MVIVWKHLTVEESSLPHLNTNTHSWRRRRRQVQTYDLQAILMAVMGVSIKHFLRHLQAAFCAFRCEDVPS